MAQDTTLVDYGVSSLAIRKYGSVSGDVTKPTSRNDASAKSQKSSGQSSGQSSTGRNTPGKLSRPSTGGKTTRPSTGDPRDRSSRQGSRQGSKEKSSSSTQKAPNAKKKQEQIAYWTDSEDELFGATNVKSTQRDDDIVDGDIVDGDIVDGDIVDGDIVDGEELIEEDDGIDYLANLKKEFGGGNLGFGGGGFGSVKSMPDFAQIPRAMRPSNPLAALADIEKVAAETKKQKRGSLLTPSNRPSKEGVSKERIQGSKCILILCCCGNCQ